jgi:hypothetical protein
MLQTNSPSLRITSVTVSDLHKPIHGISAPCHMTQLLESTEQVLLFVFDPTGSIFIEI